jgi:hypothetical protein
MDETEKRKRGLWACKCGEWHGRSEHSGDCAHLYEMRRKGGYEMKDGQVIKSKYG